jgi:alpha-galactosidase
MKNFFGEDRAGRAYALRAGGLVVRIGLAVCLVNLINGWPGAPDASGQTTNPPGVIPLPLPGSSGNPFQAVSYPVLDNNGKILWPTNFWQGNSNDLNLTVSNNITFNISNDLATGVAPLASLGNTGIMSSNQVAQLTPPGRTWAGGVPWVYSTWGLAGNAIAATDITNMVSQLEANNYLASFPRIIAIDEGWLTVAGRDSNGNLIGDPTKFPSGMSNLVAWVHSKGIGFGLYHGLGTNTESPGFKGSQASSNTLGYVIRDAQAMALWGLDYVKLNSWFDTDPNLNERQAEAMRAFIRAFRATGHNAYFWLMGTVGSFEPYKYTVGSDFRISALIDGNSLTSMSGIFSNYNLAKTNMSSIAPGHTTSMEGAFTGIANKDAVSLTALWALLNAQAIVPDVSAAHGIAYTNVELEAVRQDWNHSPYVLSNFVVGGVTNEIVVKPLGLEGTQKAVFLLNQDSSARTFTVACTNLSLGTNVVTVRDLEACSLAAYVTNGNFVISVPATTVYAYKITPGKTALGAGKYFLSDLNWTATTTNGSFGFPFQKDKASNGDPLTIGGTNYAKGLGQNADDYVEYFIGGATSFHCVAGVHDAYRASNPNVRVRLYVDDVAVLDTGTLTVNGSNLGTNINLDLTGKSRIGISITNAESSGNAIVGDSVDIADAYVTSVNGITNLPVRVQMRMNDISYTTAGVTAFTEQSGSTPTPVSFEGNYLMLTMGNTPRFGSWLPVFPEKMTAVHTFTVQATNTLNFTNNFYADMGSDVASTRHFNTLLNVPCSVTNGVNFLRFTNSWNASTDTARWLYLQWFSTSSNSAANIYVLGWDVTYQ